LAPYWPKAHRGSEESSIVIRHTERLEAFESRYANERWQYSTFEGALAIFEGLWAEASILREDLPTDWREDIEADLTMGRVLNGIPATS
jgi:hypothetical protein